MRLVIRMNKMFWFGRFLLYRLYMNIRLSKMFIFIEVNWMSVNFLVCFLVCSLVSGMLVMVLSIMISLSMMMYLLCVGISRMLVNFWLKKRMISRKVMLSFIIVNMEFWKILLWFLVFCIKWK